MLSLCVNLVAIENYLPTSLERFLKWRVNNDCFRFYFTEIVQLDFVFC